MIVSILMLMSLVYTNYSLLGMTKPRLSLMLLLFDLMIRAKRERDVIQLWGSKILYQMSRREEYQLIPCFVYSSIGKYSTARRNAQLESTIYHILLHKSPLEGSISSKKLLVGLGNRSKQSKKIPWTHLDE